MQGPGASPDGTHGFDCVLTKIYHDLLQLTSVAPDRWQIGRKFDVGRDTVSFQLISKEAWYLKSNFIHIDQSLFPVGFRKQGPDIA